MRPLLSFLKIQSLASVRVEASTLTEASDWIFKKESSGRINLDFAKVEAGAGIYCYHGFTSDSRTNRPASAVNRLLIDVSSSEVLTIELNGQHFRRTNVDE